MQIEADRKGWAALVDKYRDYDQTRIQDVKEDIDTLLVFVRISTGSFISQYPISVVATIGWSVLGGTVRVRNRNVSKTPGRFRRHDQQDSDANVYPTR